MLDTKFWKMGLSGPLCKANEDAMQEPNKYKKEIFLHYYQSPQKHNETGNENMVTKS